ncbi:interferon gamma receptor 2 isoform X1 [Hippoglossus hippoglossus]|uniref:interferon gamma receptor 2 isoform X1 n=1 Tax=Hippoglossus hippoglossus TaxID=8267 RepID=UPI00148CFC54|nr:interferon gamma receptor 2 isoform X1 [Hippoglossus hippoglossus]
MLLMLLCIQAVVQVPVVSEATPAPPQNIHVDKWLLTWTPATEERDVTYTVQYRSFGSIVWKDVRACNHTSLHSCNVTLTRDESKHGCVMLRVQAERHGLTSKPVKACSRYGDSCSPEVRRVTAQPGSLTVYLSRNHSMVWEHGDHVTHRVYYGKQEESLQQEYEDGTSSVFIQELEEGQRYCMKVQYLLYDKPAGLGSCTQCEVIPVSSHKPKQTDVIVVVVVVIFVAFLISGIGYFLIFRLHRFKQWLQPPCEIPPHFLFEPFPEHHICSYNSSIREGYCDIISSTE